MFPLSSPPCRGGAGGGFFGEAVELYSSATPPRRSTTIAPAPPARFARYPPLAPPFQGGGRARPSPAKTLPSLLGRGRGWVTLVRRER